MTKGSAWEKFQGKQIGLLGAGKENLSLVPHLLKAGAQVTLCEERADEQYIHTLEKIRDIELRIGPDALDELSDFDFIFRTPGMPVATVEKSLQRSSKKPIATSAVDLFLELYGHQTIGVTGTKGKGTTSTMIESIIKSAKQKVLLAGNIGVSIFDSLDQITEDTQIVMELSSFQLEDVRHSPHIAVVVPIVPDHLQPLSERSPNYHRSFEDYVEAKRQIVAFQSKNDLVVYAADNQSTKSLAMSSAGQKIGVGVNSGEATLKSDQLFFKELQINLAEAGIKGTHLLLDASLAAVVAIELGTNEKDILRGLKEFKPLPHRMENIGEFNGVTVIDDSYATAPDATIAALSAFTQPIILLAGGSTKGANFTELAHEITQKNVKAVILIGQEADNISSALTATNFSGTVKKMPSLESAVMKIKTIVKAGDVVLLSPGCASKDMFTDAADRGNQFVELIREHLG